MLLAFSSFVTVLTICFILVKTQAHTINQGDTPTDLPGFVGRHDRNNPYDILLAVPPSHYFLYNGESAIPTLTFCETSVIGANILQMHEVVFDLEQNRIGIAERHQCPEGTNLLKPALNSIKSSDPTKLGLKGNSSLPSKKRASLTNDNKLLGKLTINIAGGDNFIREEPFLSRTKVEDKKGHPSNGIMGEIDDSQRSVNERITSHGDNQGQIIIPNVGTQSTQDDIVISDPNQTRESHSPIDTKEESISGRNGNGNSLNSTTEVAPPVENDTSIVSPGLPQVGNGEADATPRFGHGALTTSHTNRDYHSNHGIGSFFSSMLGIALIFFGFFVTAVATQEHTRVPKCFFRRFVADEPLIPRNSHAKILPIPWQNEGIDYSEENLDTATRRSDFHKQGSRNSHIRRAGSSRFSFFARGFGRRPSDDPSTFLDPDSMRSSFRKLQTRHEEDTQKHASPTYTSSKQQSQSTRSFKSRMLSARNLGDDPQFNTQSYYKETGLGQPSNRTLSTVGSSMKSFYSTTQGESQRFYDDSDQRISAEEPSQNRSEYYPQTYYKAAGSIRNLARTMTPTGSADRSFRSPRQASEESVSSERVIPVLYASEDRRQHDSNVAGSGQSSIPTRSIPDDSIMESYYDEYDDPLEKNTQQEKYAKNVYNTSYSSCYSEGYSEGTGPFYSEPHDDLTYYVERERLEDEISFCSDHKGISADEEINLPVNECPRYHLTTILDDDDSDDVDTSTNPSSR